MWDQLKNGSSKVVKVFASNFVSAIPGLIFTATFFGAAWKFISDFWNILLGYQWYIVILMATGGAWLFATIYYKMNRFRPRYPRLDFDYEIIEKLLTYEYVDQQKMLYRRRIVLKALKNNLDHYIDKYHWTGSGEISLKSAIPEHRVHLTERKSVWQFYQIDFRRHLKKNDTIITEVVFDLFDAKGTAVPFFSATVEEPTNKLVLELRLNPSLGVKEAIAEEKITITSKAPLDIRIVPLDNEGRAIWSLSRPELLHHYELRWVMPGG